MDLFSPLHQTNYNLRTLAKHARGAIRHLAAGIFFIFLSFILASPLQAATFVVTKAADTNDGTCNSDCSLREAIAAANGAGTNDVIEFDAGVFSSPRAITLTGGTLSVSNNGSLIINGTGADKLTISGNNSTTVVTIEPQAVATINALTIAGGQHRRERRRDLKQRREPHAHFKHYQEQRRRSRRRHPQQCDADDRQLHHRGKSRRLGGRGIYNFFSGTLTITNSGITGNIVHDGIGGGLANGGMATLTATTLSGNNAGVMTSSDGGMGGGIFSGVGSITLTNSTLQNNSAIRGGGIATRGGSVSLVASTINNNIAGTGGGVCNGCSRARLSVFFSVFCVFCGYFFGEQRGYIHPQTGTTENTEHTEHTNTPSTPAQLTADKRR